MYLLVLFRQKKSGFFLKKIQINALADLKNLLYQQNNIVLERKCLKSFVISTLKSQHINVTSYSIFLCKRQ